MTAHKRRRDNLFTENSLEQQRGIEEKAKKFQQRGLIKIHNQRMVYRYWIPLLFITLLAAFLRLYSLGTYPQNFNQDEIVMGYDAFSIWITGHDHHGSLLPIYFRTFNDFVPPVANYISAPFVGILGLHEWTTRLPFALMGIATVLLVALLGRKWFTPTIGLFSAFFLTIDPWHVNYSRIAFPASTVPFFTVLALYCFTRGTDFPMLEYHGKRKSVLLWLTGSAVSFALLTGAYPTMKVEAPLLLCACLLATLPIVWKKKQRFGWYSILLWLVIYGCCISPLLISQIQNWNAIQGRFNGMSVFTQNQWYYVLLAQYVGHYNPGAFFVDGLVEGVAIHPTGIGELCWLELPLWLIAVIGLAQKRYISRRAGFLIPVLLVIWFITFPIASSITISSGPHEIRSYNFLPLPEILAGYGVLVLWEVLSKYRRKYFSLAQPTLLCCIIVALLFNSIFLKNFFAPPLLQTNATSETIPYNIGLQKVLMYVMPQIKPCDTVWLDPTNQTYIYYLFFTQYPPARFQATKTREIDAREELFASVGQVYFQYVPKNEQDIPVQPGCQGKPTRIFAITRSTERRTGWQKLIAVNNAAGIPIWQAFVKE